MLRPSLRRLLIAALFALAFAMPRPALAQVDENDPTALFDLGQKLYAEGKFAESYDAYLKAWNLKKSFDIAGNLGNVELKLAKYSGAVLHLQYVLDNLPVTMPADQRQLVVEKTTERLNDAKSRVAIMKLALTPNGAAVTLDGLDLGTTPLADPLVLDPGPHKLVATLAGHDDVTHDFAAKAGDNETLRIAMVASGSGDTAKIGTTGGDTAEDDGPNMIVVIAGGIVGLGAVGAGIALHVVAAGKGDDREALRAELGNDSACNATPRPPECDEITDLSDQESTFSGAGTGLLIGGGVVLVATALYWFWPRGGGDDAPASALVPSFGPGYAGLTFSGSF